MAGTSLSFSPLQHKVGIKMMFCALKGFPSPTQLQASEHGAGSGGWALVGIFSFRPGMQVDGQV